MKSIYKHALASLEEGTPFVLATVIRTWGSAPRKPGSHMLITDDTMMGSVSGGCVENDVFKQAKMLLGKGKTRMLHYGVSDDDAWQVGLSCGGEIDVLMEVFSPEEDSDRMYWNTIRAAVEGDSGAVIIHALADDSTGMLVLQPGEWGSDEVGKLSQLAFGRRAHTTANIGDKEFFIEVVHQRHNLLIFGAGHLTVELVELASQFDFETTLIDPRRSIIDNIRFPKKPDHLLNAWPAEVLHEIPLTPYTYAVTLSHDPKIDDQALEILLRSDVAYIGALGSKKTHAKRVSRLEAKGFTSEEIHRIHAPVGVDIRAQSAQEIALSIIADLIREKNKNVA